MMKKVLIISFHFFQKEVVGSIRIQGLFNYLSEFGWNPTILTVQPDIVLRIPENVYTTQFSDPLIVWKKRLGLDCNSTLKDQMHLKSVKNKKTLTDLVLNKWEEIILYPDAQIGWYDDAIELGSEILSNNKFDAILSSGTPFTTHIISKVLSEKFEIPWVADFRDLWTQNHYYNYSAYRHFFEQKLEIQTISRAHVLTTVSQPLAIKLKDLHKHKTIYPILNGFNPEQMNHGTRVKEKFSIVYTGTLYRGRRDPEPFFRVLNNLIDEKLLAPIDLRIDFYGPHEGWLLDNIEKYNLQSIAKIHGQVSRDMSIMEQRKAQILLLLTWNDPEEKGVYTGKLFDYLAARRPILSLGYTDGGVVKELLNQTQAGAHISNEEDLKDYLIKTYREYKERGEVQYHGIDIEVMKYSHREMARKFAEVLDKL